MYRMRVLGLIFSLLFLEYEKREEAVCVATQKPASCGILLKTKLIVQEIVKLFEFPHSATGNTTQSHLGNTQSNGCTEDTPQNRY